MTEQTRRSAPAWQPSARRLVESAAFKNTIVAVIIVNAITIGVQTYAIPGWLQSLLESADRVFLGVFVVELVLRFAADGFRPARFFRSGWNIFDFVVVAAAFIPGVSSERHGAPAGPAAPGRPADQADARHRRAVRRHAPGGRPGVQPGRADRPAVLPVRDRRRGALRRTSAPYFGNVGEALLTLFTLLTLEGWNTVMYDLRAISAAAIPFSLSFILIGTYIVINLVVGVVITSLDEAYQTRAQPEAAKHDLTQTIHELRASLDSLETKLQHSGLVDRSTASAEELEHRVEDHLHRRDVVLDQSLSPTDDAARQASS